MNHSLLAIILPLSLCAFAAAQTTPPATFVQRLQSGKPQKIVFYGTSLTHYGAWTKRLTDVLDKQFPHLVTTFNGGQSGEMSRWGLEHLKERVLDERPDVVFLEYSTNDSVERFHLSLDESRKNLETIIDQIRAARPNCQVILQVMNPVIGRPVGDAGHRVDLDKYQQVIRDVGKARGLLVIDHMPAWQRLLDQGEGEFKKYVPDGLHPGGPGIDKYMMPTLLAALGLKA